MLTELTVPSYAVPLILASLSLPLILLVAFLVYVVIRYIPIIGRIFEEKPLFLPLRLAREEGGEDVRFTASDGIALDGSYFRNRAPARIGVLVFCHEYLSDRWSFRPYADHLRDLGFDVFTFDFRNHGQSGSDPSYQPLQWVSDHEVRDLNAALAYLRSRPDHDTAGFGLFGVSRGGGTALVVGANDPGVWGVITDGAFPTRGTMLAYILRWAEIYVSNPFFWKAMPIWIFAFLGWVARIRSSRRLHCRFPDVEKAVARLAPRPWLMIHGEKDAYIGPSIARRLFAEAREPKECWIVPKAKHNRCRELEPKAYAERIAAFFRQYAPRRPIEAEVRTPRDAAPAPSVEKPKTARAGGLAASATGS
jgi:pimeloyl-ACP methyl ester carboxylesterase